MLRRAVASGAAVFGAGIAANEDIRLEFGFRVEALDFGIPMHPRPPPLENFNALDIFLHLP
jgi:hypothetical protein